MRNQTSFRLTTTLLPTDTTAKTTTVINKVDSNGDKFYPTFTEETVVLTNDDRTVMETTRAVCTDGVLTFTKRGLSDDDSETQIPNRKLTWNPGTLAFITAGAGDWIDKDDDITWSGDQTYAGDMTSQGTATYKGRLITEKGVEYPHFDSLEDLQAYTDPFGGMFAVVDSDGELYRYNDVSDTWSVVTTSTPAQPAKASTTAIGTVRGATDAEFAAGTATGSQGELLVATPEQIQTVAPTMTLHRTNLGNSYNVSFTSHNDGDKIYVTYTVPRDGWIRVQRGMAVRGGKQITDISYDEQETTSILIMPYDGLGDFIGESYPATVGTFNLYQTMMIPVSAGVVKLYVEMNPNRYSRSLVDGACEVSLRIRDFFYYG